MDRGQNAKTGPSAGRISIHDAEANAYTCPGGKKLGQFNRQLRHPPIGRRQGRISKIPRAQRRLRRVRAQTTMLSGSTTSKKKALRSIHEDARDFARAINATPDFQQSRRDRKKVEMPFAHLKRILKLDRLRLRGPCGAQDEFLLAATAQNLRKLAKLRPKPPPVVQPA